MYNILENSFHFLSFSENQWSTNGTVVLREENWPNATLVITIAEMQTQVKQARTPHSIHYSINQLNRNVAATLVYLHPFRRRTRKQSATLFFFISLASRSLASRRRAKSLRLFWAIGCVCDIGCITCRETRRIHYPHFVCTLAYAPQTHNE